MKNLKKDNKGFSLVELLVVIAIMVVLVGVIAPSLLRNIEKSRVSKDVQNLDNIAAAIQAALMVEDANADAPQDGTAYEFSRIYKADDSFFKDLEFTAEVKANLPTGDSIALSSKNVKPSTTAKIYFKITDKGAIEVFASKDGTNVLDDGNGQTFKVTR